MTHAKKWRIILVFDGRDALGDKYETGNLTVIEAPRENGKEAADEKILEILKKELKKASRRSGYYLVTDDAALKEAAEMIAIKYGAKLIFMGAKEFWDKINPPNGGNDEIFEGETRGLNENEQAKINEEMLRIWK